MIRTVLGALDPAELGVCNAHDHLFLASHRLPGAELGDSAAALSALQAYARAGGNAVVQWTPAGLGRRMAELTGLSRATGVHIVAATGRHRREHYRDGHPLLGLDGEELTVRFVTDLLEGGCGLVKVGTGYRSLDEHEERSLEAAAQAGRQTGAPVAVHLELGTHGGEVIDVLKRHGLPCEQVILGHLGRNPDLGEIAGLAGRGCFLAFDGPSQRHHGSDWRLPELISGLVERGFGDQILLGGDTTTAAARHAPGMAGLLRITARRLGREVGEAALASILTANPARALTWRSGAPG